MGEDGDSEGSPAVRDVVLLDYPLRLWARQQEHADEVLREFTLLLRASHMGSSDPAPTQLRDLARLLDDTSGPQIGDATAARQERLDAGADRMDWRLPLPPGTPALRKRIDAAWQSVDRHCRAGDLLTLPRPAEVVALQTWATAEITAQFGGAAASPWPGPF